MSHMLHSSSHKRSARGTEGRAEKTARRGRGTHLLPCADGVGLAGSLHGSVVLAEADEGRGQAGVVVHVAEDDLGGLEQALVEAAVSHNLHLWCERKQG